MDLAILELHGKAILLERVKEAEDGALPLTAVVDGDMSQGLARGETTVERRMYRALVALAAMQGEPVSNLCPVPNNSKGIP